MQIAVSSIKKVILVYVSFSSTIKGPLYDEHFRNDRAIQYK